MANQQPSSFTTNTNTDPRLNPTSNPNPTPNPTHPPTLSTQITQELQTRYTLTPTPQWLTTFLTTIRTPPPPIPALTSTAHFRLLLSDITQSLSPTSNPIFPPDINDPTTKHLTLQYNITVQVLDIVDVGVSKMSQIEAIERVERGEEVHGREIVRNVPGLDEANTSNGGDGSAGAGAGSREATGASQKKLSRGPHRLLLQDVSGTKVWGFELVGVPRICVGVGVEDGGMQVGAKMVLKKGVVVRRGLVMLEPGGCTVLGGKVEEWDRAWRGLRKERLLKEVQRENGD